MPDNVTQLHKPNRDAMLTHLEHLFGGFLDGCHDGMVELAWEDAQSHKWRGEHHDLDDLDAIVDRAVAINSVPGQSVYVGAAIRKPGTFPAMRANDDDHYASTAMYVDLDAEGAAEAAKSRYRGCPPTAAVVTGRNPHTRVQLWWRLETPERDPAAHRAQCAALAAAFGGDQVVVNPSRIMRLGGSIAWPKKPGRVTEITECHVFTDRHRMVAGQLAKAYPPVEKPLDFTAPAPPAPPAPSADGEAAARSPMTGMLRPSVLLDRIRAGNQWHNHMIQLVAHWVGRGWSDSEILGQAAGITLPGYTVADTAREMAVAVRGARAKWAKPNAETEFDPVTGEVATPFSETPSRIVGMELTRGDLDDIPPREWVYGFRLVRKFTSILVSPGGIGKTSYAVAVAMSCASGTNLLGDEPHGKLKVWVYNLEDPMEELRRRIAAAERHYGMVDGGDVLSRVVVSSGRDNPLLVAKAIGKDEYIATPDVAAMVAEIKRLKVDVVIIDPFVMTHSVPENSNEATEFVVRQFNRIAGEANCAVLLIHHTRKGAQAGDAESSRGGGAIVGAARACFTLSPMSREEGQSLNVSDDERRFLIRLDDAKANMAPKEASAIWMKMVGVNLGNGNAEYPKGDNVQVCTSWTPPDPHDGLTTSIANQILDRIDAGQVQEDGTVHPYALANRARKELRGTSSDRWAGLPVMDIMGQHGQERSEKQAQRILETWIGNGVLEEVDFADDRNRPRKGLRVIAANRPGATHD